MSKCKKFQDERKVFGKDFIEENAKEFNQSFTLSVQFALGRP